MSRDSIDRLEQLDLPNLAAADLIGQHFTGRGINIGAGRDKKKLYRSGVQTPIGDIEISVWIRAAEYIIEREGLQEELEHLRPYALYTPSANRLTKQLEYERHLDMCLSGLYRNPAWVCFVPYNQQYHPELLEGVPMVQIIPRCCKELCSIPQAQIKAETAPCPICGRWSSFRYVDADGQTEHEKKEEIK